MNKKNLFDQKVKFSTVMFVLGVVLILGEIIINIISPVTGLAMGRWLSSFGIFFFMVGLINLVRYQLLARDESVAKRAWMEENDERSLSIRNSAGYWAFLFNLVVSVVALMIYSNMSRGTPGFDWLWCYMAFAVLGPTIIFIILLVYLQKRQ